MPADFEDLTDEEIAAEVRERLAARGDAFVRVQVSVLDGKVTLAGEIPNEDQRNVALQLIDDVAGLTLADHMKVTIGWEKQEEPLAPPADEASAALARAEGTDPPQEDPIAPAETGEPYDPPSEPIPEER